MKQQADFLEGDFARDAAQAVALKHLRRVYRDIAKAPPPPASNMLAWMKFPIGRLEPEAVKGLYLWGGVGRGKTFLMDSFYEALPETRKLRMHFHRFMHRVQADLKKHRGQPDPLSLVTRRFASEARVLCFDEFFVSDIADAMILAGLLKGFFDRGITLVATSNIPPDELYRDGLQRARFLPAIELLTRYTDIVEVDGGEDYRLRVLKQAGIYHTPLNAHTDQKLEASFDDITTEPGSRDSDIEVEGRAIRTLRCAHGVVWFDFEAICGGPRSKDDYIEISRWFPAVLVSGVPVFNGDNGGNDDDRARRFVSLIDEFYDRRVKLIVSAAAPASELYQGKRLQLEFERTASRLIEMQSADYLAQQHLP